MVACLVRHYKFSVQLVHEKLYLSKFEGLHTSSCGNPFHTLETLQSFRLTRTISVTPGMTDIHNRIIYNTTQYKWIHHK